MIENFFFTIKGNNCMKLHRKFFKALGYEIIKSKKHPTPGSHTINLINQYDIDLVLDVGANTGQFAEKLRIDGYVGDIHSFEPVTATFQYLLDASNDDSKWHIHKKALSFEEGELEINISESSDLSSFLDANVYGKDRFAEIKKSGSEVVDVSTVDVFLEKKIPNYRSRNIFLKMDTQGFDLQVFAGASKSINSIVCLLSELSFTHIYDGMPHYLESLKRYEDSGFAVSGLFPICRKSKKDFTVVEMDCMMLNQSIQKLA